VNTAPEASLEGWDSGPVDGANLAEVVEYAFDYRGDITLLLDDGRQIVGYLFNRDRDVAEPFVQVFERGDAAPHTIPYARIRAIRFSGKDTAAGNSYAAWLRLRQAAKASSGG
jgi:hypothetical protein